MAVGWNVWSRDTNHFAKIIQKIMQATKQEGGLNPEKCTFAWKHAHISACYQSWQNEHNGACVLSDRKEAKRGGGVCGCVCMGGPSSWVIFNQQGYHDNQMTCETWTHTPRNDVYLVKVQIEQICFL